MKRPFHPLSGAAAKEKLFYGFNVRDPSECTLSEPEKPRPLSLGGFFICLRGETDFSLNGKPYRLMANDMCLAFPFSHLQIVRISADFSGFGIGATVELFNDIRIPSLTDYYLYIKDNPCLSLTPSEREMLAAFCRQILLNHERASHPFRTEIAHNLFRALYYEIAALYRRGRPISPEGVSHKSASRKSSSHKSSSHKSSSHKSSSHKSSSHKSVSPEGVSHKPISPEGVSHKPISRKDLLFRNFLLLLSKRCPPRREVEYYASELCITARHLSSVIKEKTNRTALAWIAAHVIRQAKTLLEDPHLTIQQVSDELNFANPSFFGQYFKRETGLTPKEFRNNGK